MAAGRRGRLGLILYPPVTRCYVAPERCQTHHSLLGLAAPVLPGMASIPFGTVTGTIVAVGFFEG